MDTTAAPTDSPLRARVSLLAERAIAGIRGNAFPLALFAILRAWTLLWASVITALALPSPEATRNYYGMPPLRDAVIAPWQRWDTIWYTKIATEGYTLKNIEPAFFPLYPFLIRSLNFLTFNNAIATGLLIASLAALASFILFYQMARGMAGEAAARRALLFLALFPTAFFLFAVYTESLFLALTLGAFLCVRSGRWEWGSMLGGLAAATRPQGALLVLPLFVEFSEQYRHGRVAGGKLWTLALVAVGTLAYVGWLGVQFGDPRAWFAAQESWRHFAPPWEVLGGALYQVVYAPSLSEAIVSFVDPFFAVLFLAALLWSWFRLPPSYMVYLAVILLPSFFSYFTLASFFPLASLSRFVSVAFPAFLLLGTLKKSWWQAPLLALSFVLQTFWLMLFVAWVFVG